MSDELQRLFNENIITKRSGSCSIQIECKKGLWGVSAPNERAAKNEAMHYFVQYLSDGEYDE